MRPTNRDWRSGHDPADVAAMTRKDRAFHDRIAPTYDRAMANQYEMYRTRHFLPWLRRVVGRHRDGTALDIGTGTADAAVALAEHGLNTYGVDHSREMLAIGQKKQPRLRLIQGDILALPFPDASFDVVTVYGVFHHVPLAFERAVAEMMRVLRPGGDFYLTEPCDDLSPVGRAFRCPLWFSALDPDGDETDEEAIPWQRMEEALAAHRIRYRVHFMTHVPSAHFHYWLPESVRMGLTRALSAPFRSGDLLCVQGQRL